jgi:hypothetical protein
VSRELPRDEDEGTEPPEPPTGHVSTTGPGIIVGFALTGLVLGWLLRPASIRIRGTAPTVGWTPVLALILVAVILGAVAWSTYRDLHPKAGRPPRRLEPHQAVNRLVLAKACALAGAMVAGGYFGYALSWWRVSEAALAQQRIVQSLIAGLASVFIVAASLLLERACRVRDGDDSDLT